jgi:O-antigen/teichoic acid export membrane protein
VSVALAGVLRLIGDAALPSRFARNTLSIYLHSATSLVVALVTTPILVHHLGVTEFGIWVLAGSVLLYLELFEFGFGTATVAYVARFAATGDHERVKRAIATSMWMLTGPGVAVAVAAVAFAALLPSVVDLPADLVTPARVLLLLLALDLAVSMPGDTFGGTLAAFQRYDLLNFTLAAVLAAQAIAWIIVIVAGGGLVALGVVTVLLSLAGQLTRFLLARRLVPALSLSPRMVDRSLARPYAGLSFWFALSSIAETVVRRVDAVVVGVVVSVPAVGVYAVGQKLSQLAQRFIAPATLTFFPYAAELAARGNSGGLRRSLMHSVRISLFVAGPVGLGTAVLAGPALEAWVGEGFGQARLVVVYLATATAVAAMGAAAVVVVNGMGLPRVPALIYTCEAVLNLALSIVLGRETGLKGVALATLIASAATTFTAMLPYACRLVGVSYARLLWEALWDHVPAAGAALLVAWVLSGFARGGLVQVVAAGIAVVGVYAGTLLVIGLGRGRALNRSRRTAEPESSPS